MFFKDFRLGGHPVKIVVIFLCKIKIIRPQYIFSYILDMAVTLLLFIERKNKNAQNV